MEDKKDDKKKQLLLRLSPTIYNEIQIWAQDDFRSINGQIEYLLHEMINERRKRGKKDVKN